MYIHVYACASTYDSRPLSYRRVTPGWGAAQWCEVEGCSRAIDNHTLIHVCSRIHLMTDYPHTSYCSNYTIYLLIYHHHRYVWMHVCMHVCVCVCTGTSVADGRVDTMSNRKWKCPVLGMGQFPILRLADRILAFVRKMCQPYLVLCQWVESCVGQEDWGQVIVQWPNQHQILVRDIYVSEKCIIFLYIFYMHL